MRTSGGGGRWRGRVWVGLIVVVLVGGCGSSGGDADDVRPTDAKDSPSPPPSRAGFVVRYEEPVSADRGDAAFLRARRPMEAAVEALGAFVDPGREIAVVGRSCGGAGSAYDPETRRIEVCYDDIADERALFERGGHRPADDEVVAVLVETLYHEAGHALADVLRLPFDERAEEDAADRFAALMLLRQGVGGERQLRAAVEEYRLSAAEADGADRDTKDEHAPDLVRAADHLCRLYGAAPDRNPDLANTSLLPRERVAGCPAEWKSARDAWLKDLAPILRR
ncbi:DUF4344 domain-containing metallopeptidase [Embleya hyalina]|uniref:DUF4344 domain-containing metallopeptidase n=1 Tax=Embleya hyalina TaxID=516124 RepID=UPI000F836C6C|nr:DUF4344 domain-containing metallopeptidase [Embleya hyalina]